MWSYKSGQEVFLIWQLFHILGWSNRQSENSWHISISFTEFFICTYNQSWFYTNAYELVQNYFFFGKKQAWNPNFITIIKPIVSLRSLHKIQCFEKCIKILYCKNLNMKFTSAKRSKEKHILSWLFCNTFIKLLSKLFSTAFSIQTLFLSASHWSDGHGIQWITSI